MIKQSWLKKVFEGKENPDKVLKDLLEKINLAEQGGNSNQVKRLNKLITYIKEMKIKKLESVEESKYNEGENVMESLKQLIIQSEAVLQEADEIMIETDVAVIEKKKTKKKLIDSVKKNFKKGVKGAENVIKKNPKAAVAAAAGVSGVAAYNSLKKEAVELIEELDLLILEAEVQEQMGARMAGGFKKIGSAIKSKAMAPKEIFNRFRANKAILNNPQSSPKAKATAKRNITILKNKLKTIGKAGAAGAAVGAAAGYAAKK